MKTTRAAGKWWSRAQSTLELAMVMPVVGLLLLAVADFARAYHAGIEVANAARAGVQYGAQNRTTAVDYSGMQTAAAEDASDISGVSATATSFCMCDTSTVSCTSSCADGIKNYVQVTTSATFNTTIKYPGIPTSVPLSAQAVMEVNE